MTRPGRTKVLLTAFEPFGGETVNPSAEAARRVLEVGVDGAELVLVVLPVVYGAAGDALLAAVAAHRPELVVCLGQAGGRSGITPERVAVNLDHARADDNAGQRPTEAPVVAGGPVGYFSTLPVAAVVDALTAAGIPSAASSTAGHYVCNHVFYRLMHHLDGTDVRGGFVHVPYADEQVVGRADGMFSLPLATIAEGVRVVVATALVRAVATTGGGDGLR